MKSRSRIELHRQFDGPMIPSKKTVDMGTKAKPSALPPTALLFERSDLRQIIPPRRDDYILSTFRRRCLFARDARLGEGLRRATLPSARI